MKRKICVVSGSRAEYGLLKPVISAIAQSRDLGLILFVTGSHLSREFGRTVHLIKKDGFRIDKEIEMTPEGDGGEFMSLAIAKGIAGITAALKGEKPDIVLILGDRIEALATAIAAAYLNITIAHIHGGDRSKAGLDESARHAITKLAHIHFAATKRSRDRIIRMGENSQNVFLVGAPGLDSIVTRPLLSREELAEKYNFDARKPFLMLVQHPVTTQTSEAAKQIRETLAAIKRFRLTTFVIYPNSDAGGRRMIKEIEKERNSAFLKIFKNLPRELYLSLLKHAVALVGNSSSGIIEAASFKTPVVNIGIRQEGRQRSTNVIDVMHDKNAIIGAIEKALYDKKFKGKLKHCKNPYGDGRATERIVKVLSKIKINKELLQKNITY